eukprot:scaffold22496_cov95-Phaeocystis_antarctica.AAC.1
MGPRPLLAPRLWCSAPACGASAASLRALSQSVEAAQAPKQRWPDAALALTLQPAYRCVSI